MWRPRPLPPVRAAGGEERLEDVRAEVVGDAPAVVGVVDADAAVVGGGGELDPAADSLAVGVDDRVEDQVGQHLGQRAGVAP